jgi:hypothetical protein
MPRAPSPLEGTPYIHSRWMMTGRMRGTTRALSILGLLLLQFPPRPARAQLMFPPITSRNYNLDLFEQPALGSPRLIAMSGAIDAVAEGAAGLYTNPGSAAIRPETRSDKFTWASTTARTWSKRQHHSPTRPGGGGHPRVVAVAGGKLPRSVAVPRGDGPTTRDRRVRGAALRLSARRARTPGVDLGGQRLRHALQEPRALDRFLELTH